MKQGVDLRIQENTLNGSLRNENTDQLYDENDTKHLNEFHDVAFDSESKEWKLCPDSDDTEKFIKVEYKKGKYGVLISRATTTITNNHLATPEHLYLFLLNDWKMFYYLSRKTQISLKHSINKFKRIVEAVVYSNSSVAYPRNYLYYEIFAFCDENGKICSSHKLQNDKQRKLIAIMKSVNKNDKKYYSKAADTQVRGTFYRTGYALQNVSKNESKLVVTVEYDMKGSNVVRSFGNGFAKCTEISSKMCQRLKKQFEFIVSYSHNICNNYNILQIENKKKENEIIELKKTLLQFKDWKEWKIDEFVIWISCLENNKYKKYEQILLKAFKNQQFKVSNLDKVTENDLYTFGVKLFDDKKCLFQHIQALVNGKKDTPNVNNDFDHIHINDDINDVDSIRSMENNDINYDSKIDDNEYENDNEYESENNDINYDPKIDENNNVLGLENWSTLYDNDGRPYYLNKITNKTQWENPKTEQPQ